MSKHYTPCDYGRCPYDARYSEDCRVHCGLGVDDLDAQPDCPGAPDGLHDFTRTLHNHELLWVCRHCGEIMPDPPASEPPPYGIPCDHNWVEDEIPSSKFEWPQLVMRCIKCGETIDKIEFDKMK